MATTYIHGIEVWSKRTSMETAYHTIAYIENPAKTRNGELVSAFRCDPNSAYLEMMLEQKSYEQETGRKVIVKYTDGRKSYLLMHMRQSFLPGEVTPEQAHEIGRELADRFLKGKYQYVIATHIDKAHIHNHIIFNIIGDEQRKFRQTKYIPRQLRALSDRLCEEHGLSVVVPVEGQKRRYTNEKTTSFRTVLKNDIDRCILEAQDYEDFLRRMRKEYTVDDTGKYLKFRNRLNGQQRMIRSYTLGKGYNRQDIKMRIEAEEAIINPITFSQKLRDIEAMIHAAGYIRENGSDFDRQEKQLKTTIKETKVLLDEMDRRLTYAESISRCFNALDRFGPDSQGGDTELYRSAQAILKANGINPDSSERNRFRSELSLIRSEADQLKDRYRSAQAQLNRVEEVKEISKRVQNDDRIIGERKGGKQHGR
ncbi:Relaxase/Mobilization nuclease domain protein [Caprobacter fermentans]|uniref:Relaxase/Mobilization nuclease domain protein n=1 Tax=Caproicibacter fermentans TaxID=2576756 RepID=A0A6N8I282_9FIRM|nr:relaxase/mobilization nuclease domain-containing protein [Caproicibacter fermentans]MVB11633.1 Relaxase/Mobilization nuclease domain protein [Caproicibacter fermentans]